MLSMWITSHEEVYRGWKKHLEQIVWKCNLFQKCMSYVSWLLITGKIKYRTWRAPWDADNMFQNSERIRWSDSRQRESLHSKGGILGSQERFVESKQLCRKATRGNYEDRPEKRGRYFLWLDSEAIDLIGLCSWKGQEIEKLN